MRRLWKGLFYATWHADKAPAQAELIGRLSSLLLSLSLPLAVEYFSAFLITLRREWPGIDNLRLDKFYLLIRRFIHSLFSMLKKKYCWDLDTVTRFMGMLEENAFFTDDKFISNGVNYHIASVFLEELVGFLPLRAEIIEVMFKPFMSVMAKCQDKILVGKVKSNLFDVLLKMGRSLLESRKSGEESVGDDKAVLLGPMGLKMGFSGKFYELGTSSDCLQGNRKVMLRLFEDFLRLEKDLASSGIEVSIPNVMVDDEEEVPELIPISDETEENGNGSDMQLKKNKKAKKVGALDKVDKKANKRKKNYKDNVVVLNGENTSEESARDEPELIFTESVISNLRKQFEKVAAELDLDNGGSNTHGSAEGTVNASVSMKRKRVRSTDGKGKKKITSEEDETNLGEKSSEKSAKKVRFSMKSNLVWMPHSPMPPQSLRIPPSVTPRGSALKKGVRPGPIREIPPATKKAKLKRKKARKVSKISPAVKRLRKLQMISV